MTRVAGRGAGLLLAVLVSGCAPRQGIVLDEQGCFRATGADADRITVTVADSTVPLFGESRREGGELVFQPRFPLREGMTYRATAGPLEATFSVPARAPSPPTVLRHIHPSRDVLPENQLKFYLHFSAPMARGDAYRRIRLVESGGKEVDMPFLELGEELWDRTGTRLTLFFDPGRIKRGLKPREEAGPLLEEGKSYTLAVDAEWRDAAGRPLKEGYRKAFKVGPPDDRQPDPRRWKLTAPSAGTREPLTVVFDEPLDAGMLSRVVAVLQAGSPVGGRVEVDQDETRWRLHPESPWKAGQYALGVDSVLEDLAGNSVGRPFEVDVFRDVERKIGSSTVTVPFEVR